MPTSIRIDGSDSLKLRLRNMQERHSPESPAVRAVLIRAAALINLRAAGNVRRHGMRMTGRLLNSFGYEFFDSGKSTVGIHVGSFGVPYAKLMEEGGDYTPAMRKAMFANLRKYGRLSGAGKGMLKGNRLQARPYLKPAFEQSKERIMGLLSEGLFTG